MAVFQGAPVEDTVLGTDLGKSSAYVQSCCDAARM